MNDVLHQFWAKKGDVTPEVHYPLLFHMVDVAVASQTMWDRVIQQGTKNFLSEQLSIPEVSVRHLIAFWTGLHDIGKATPAFQSKSNLVKL